MLKKKICTSKKSPFTYQSASQCLLLLCVCVSMPYRGYFTSPNNIHGYAFVDRPLHIPFSVYPVVYYDTDIPPAGPREVEVDG